MLKKLFVAVAAVAAIAVPATNTSAQPPQSEVWDDFIVLFPDLNINKSVFINITARDFCNWEAEASPFFEWLDAFFLWQDYQGYLDAGGLPEDFPIQPPPTDPGPPPPDPGPPPAIDPVTARGVATGKGAVVGKIDAQDLYVEVWEFDEDPSPLIGPCEDIQAQLDDPTAEPWATGTADFKAKNNDAFGSGTRGVAFGDRTTAELTDQDGNTYLYRNVFRLNEQCHAPEFAPPACLVDNSQLKS